MIGFEMDELDRTPHFFVWNLSSYFSVGRGDGFFLDPAECQANLLLAEAMLAGGGTCTMLEESINLLRLGGIQSCKAK